MHEWLTYLETIHPKTIDMGLNRIRAVAERLSIKPRCPVVTVAGTNGKGTTVAALQTLASHAGWRVGVYTSPHLLTFNERIVLDLPGIGAQPVSDQQLIAAFETIEAARKEITLTYFEFATLAALLIFQETPIDLMILEVGLGGRLDSTNLIDADIAIITRIALDHMDYLGNTREAIAGEKAGIMRLGKPCIYGGEDLHECLKTLADQHGALLHIFNETFTADELIHKASQEAHIPIANLSCAKEAFRLLGGNFHPKMWQSLLEKKPAGRFMSVPYQNKTIIFDVAHNPDAMELLAKQLKSLPYANIRLVVGMLEDKDHQASLAPLIADPRIVYYVSSPQHTSRAAKPERLMNVLQDAPALAFNTLTEAWEASQKDSLESTLWVVTGSFFTVAEVLGNLPLCYT